MECGKGFEHRLEPARHLTEQMSRFSDIVVAPAVHGNVLEKRKPAVPVCEIVG